MSDVERDSTRASLIDILDRVLDKGIVVDAWVRVSVVGVDLITMEARIVVSSIETYVNRADAVARLPTGLTRSLEHQSPNIRQLVRPPKLLHCRESESTEAPADNRIVSAPGTRWALLGSRRWRRLSWIASIRTSVQTTQRTDRLPTGARPALHRGLLRVRCFVGRSRRDQLDQRLVLERQGVDRGRRIGGFRNALTNASGLRGCGTDPDD
jgi:hypothetical protein